MKRLFILLGAGALLTSAVLQGCKGGGGAVDLKLNFQPGSKYLSTMETKMTMDQGGIGQTHNDMTMETTYDVAQGEGTDRKITVTYDRIAMAVSNPMMNMAYDSKEPEKGDSMLKSMGNMLNKPFTMTVTDKGEIMKVEGLEQILSNIGDPNTPQGANLRRQMSGLFNDTAIRSMMQQSLNIFPDKTVRPGDSWKKTFTTNMGPMSMKVDNNYKLVSVSKNVAHIDVASKISTGAPGAENMQNVKIEMNGEQKGDMDVDVASGLVTESKMKQTIKGTVSSMGTQIPMTIITDIHITGKKQ